MHEGKLRYGKPMGDLPPIGKGVYLSLKWPYQSYRNNVREMTVFKGLDKLFQVKPAVGDDARVWIRS
jgi:hypothetical protein